MRSPEKVIKEGAELRAMWYAASFRRDMFAGGTQGVPVAFACVNHAFVDGVARWEEVGIAVDHLR